MGRCRLDKRLGSNLRKDKTRHDGGRSYISMLVPQCTELQTLRSHALGIDVNASKPETMELD